MNALINEVFDLENAIKRSTITLDFIYVCRLKRGRLSWCIGLHLALLSLVVGSLLIVYSINVKGSGD